MVRAVEEGSKRPSKSLKGSKLRRTSNLTFSKTGLKLHTKKTVIAFVLENHRIRYKYVQKYFYTFTINKIIFTNGERKKERPNFYGMFSQNVPISNAFIAILEMELPQCNAIGVRTRPAMPQSEKSKQKNCRFVEIKNVLSLSQNVAPFPSVFSGCRFSGTRLSLHF